MTPPAAARATEPAAPLPLTEPAPHNTRSFEPVIERGTGMFVRQPPPRSRASIEREASGLVTINVVDADVREVVRLILAEMLSANYVVDPAVQGTITVQTTQPVPAEDLVPLLDGVLRVNGAALVRADNMYNVVPIERALTSGLMSEIRRVPEAQREGFVLQVVPVRFVAASELADLLLPFIPSAGSVQVDADRNLLLLAGSADQLATLGELVSMFDADWLAGMSFGLFPLKAADAGPLVDELDQIFGQEEGPLAGIVRFLPIERMNAILVMSAQAAYVDRARSWIRRLDQTGDGEEPRIFVYSVQNGRAADLAAVLGEIFEVPTAAVAAPPPLAPGLQPVRIETSLFDQHGDAALSEGLTGRVGPADSLASGHGGSTRSASSAGTARLGGSTSPGQRPPLTEGEVRIIADQTTNSLVIRASPRDYRKIEDSLKELDVLPLQVLIEATIAEVRLTDELSYGLQWFFQSGDFTATLSQSALGTVAPQFPGFAAVFDSGDIRVVLSALEEVTDVNVISSPQLLVLDNHTAHLQVGDQVPVAVQSAVSVTDADAPIVNSFEQRDTGVILSVTPRVNASGLVIMEIQQEVSDVVQSETQTAAEQITPTISQRRIRSAVAVQSGETVALGGLIQDDRDRSRRGVPLLSRLPILGALFGARSNIQTRTELLVLITPRVVRDPTQAREVTDELRQRIRGVQALSSKVR